MILLASNMCGEESFVSFQSAVMGALASRRQICEEAFAREVRLLYRRKKTGPRGPA